MASAETVFSLCLIARLLKGRKHVVIGANLPIPATAGLLAKHLSRGVTEVSILGSRKYNHFRGLGDLHAVATQGGLDGFFMSPGQVDGQGNINMVGVGKYPQLDVRWPGSHGTPLYYMMVPNIILFRAVHKKRIFVPKVDFISAAGVSPPNVFRPGGPSALVTNLGYFSFDRIAARFRLESIHPGHSLDEIVEETGFEFDRSDALTTTAAPEPEMIEALHERIAAEVAEIYPKFSATLQLEVAAYRSEMQSAPGMPAFLISAAGGRAN
jgi:glutaconate CoA-transferase subunit B